ncbi:TatD family hydrolase [Endozoicomonas sp. SCSIO W0465]|uniref:TatD family hydrolase n=1 Tax=Endozoicomonas sp. SCSIO W0465 TaxID=2918516 RepID=UPI002075C0B9|nr:TatD family hydrolase [Endozoicomonas sp. SCSIO W0465]USE38548.1 TatD family hydrolase [Endozoicomonas sp. SCSIO W0465]
MQANVQLPLFDSHCHLNFSDFDGDRAQVLNRAKKSGISHICIPATKQQEWLPLIHESEVPSKENPVDIVMALGLHPWFISEHKPEYLEVLDKLLEQRSARVVAIGETGLDFFDHNTAAQVRDKQLALFTGHVELACLHKMPLIIHSRKSHDDILQVLRRWKPERAGIIHAFSGSEQQAMEYLKLDFKLGFGGGITYPRASKTRHLAATLPINSIVLETDAPDMPLNGYQGQRNEPGRVKLVAECLAELRGISFMEVAQATSHNCRSLFRI